MLTLKPFFLYKVPFLRKKTHLHVLKVHILKQYNPGRTAFLKLLFSYRISFEIYYISVSESPRCGWYKTNYKYEKDSFPNVCALNLYDVTKLQDRLIWKTKIHLESGLVFETWIGFCRTSGKYFAPPPGNAATCTLFRVDNL